MTASRISLDADADAGADVLAVTSSWPHDDDPRHPDADRYGIFIKRQVEALRRLGIRIDVLFIRGFASQRAYVDAALMLGRSNAARRARYAVVHAHGGEAGLAALFYRRAPVIVSYCGDDLLGTPRADATVPFASRLRRSVIRQSAHGAAATITRSREMELTLPAAVRRRNHIIPSGVDTDVFTPIPRDEARRLLGWPLDRRIVVFAADPAIPRKRFALAQEACDIARGAVPDLALRILHGVPPSEMPTYVNAADCLLLTSSIEGSPNVVKEALMCNVPVVSTRVGDVAELLRDVSPSFACDADPVQLASALTACVSPPARSNGRRAVAHLGGTAIAERVLEVYRACAPSLRDIGPDGLEGRHL